MSTLCGLPRAAALSSLARNIWYARALIHKLDVVAWDADHEGAFAWSYGLRPYKVWRGGEPIQF